MNNIDKDRRFQDMMDPTRRVQVQFENRDTYTCKVIFRDTGFAGYVEIPKGLFTENPFERDGRTLTLLGRIGFAPVGTRAREAE